jgi:hypothetical protein
VDIICCIIVTISYRGHIAFIRLGVKPLMAALMSVGDVLFFSLCLVAGVERGAKLRVVHFLVETGAGLVLLLFQEPLAFPEKHVVFACFLSVRVPWFDSFRHLIVSFHVDTH